MKALLRIIRMQIRAERAAIGLGLLLSFIVLVMGAALLGLSGWFITASAAAGIAGVGALFNVFLPSAMVRFLALGRTAARYGERLATHDAVLRTLSVLRLRLLQGLLTRPYRQLERLRAATALNRITADVDSLDGALLRVVLPGLAGGLAILLATALLWVLVHPAIALIVGLGYLALPTALFVLGERHARAASRQAEAALQATRNRLVELVSAREDLTVYGQIPAATASCETAITRHEDARQRLDRIERRAGFGLNLIGAGIAAATLGVGGALVQAGQLDAARAAIAVFVALALAEAVAPVRRALTEIGRMVQAARRIAPSLHAAEEEEPTPAAPMIGAEPILSLEQVSLCAGGSGTALFELFSAKVAPGEMLALTGPSGVGKSTLLLIAAGAVAPDRGRVLLDGIDLRDLPSGELHRHLIIVPQRGTLVAGTIAENLRLAGPEADDATLWQALEVVCLKDTIHAKGGLEARLGQRGSGLSGGEARRLVLARALLCRPKVLLLDEPTEGLDTATANRVMAGIRAALPRAAILTAAHRAAERSAADRVISLRRPNI
ncbi:MAG: thiol reductant ABC exporter subunit CydC [Rhodobacterales bacterium]|nr:MAG: thiol reductant ABC exporter subunit CydC [Rhodobacterales bacterium]